MILYNNSIMIMIMIMKIMQTFWHNYLFFKIIAIIDRDESPDLADQRFSLMSLPVKNIQLKYQMKQQTESELN